MSDFRQANFIPLINSQALDWLKANYVNLRFIVPASSTFQVTGAFEANLPGIAYEVFRETGLWWAIAIYNDIFDPLVDVVAGMELKIPDMTALTTLLESLDETGSTDVLI